MIMIIIWNTKTHVVPVVVDFLGLVSTNLKKHLKRVGVMI